MKDKTLEKEVIFDNPTCDGMKKIKFNDGTYGYENKEGKIVAWGLKNANGFCNGIARVQFPDKFYGYIDKQGNIISKRLSLKDADTFFDRDLTRVQFKDSYLGYINKEGLVVTEGLKIIKAEKLEGNLAFFQLKSQEWMVINKDGDLLISNLKNIPYFVENFAVIESKKTGYKAFMNKQGEIIAKGFRTLDNFKDGVTRAQFQDKSWGIINTKGENLSKNSKIKYIDPFYGEYARVKLTKGNFGFINKKGEIVLSGKKFKNVEKLFSFEDGMACVQFKYNSFVNSEDVRSGITDKNGNVVAKGFRTCFPFVEGLARVQLGNRSWGFINKRGAVLVKGLKGVENFDGGFAKILLKNGKYACLCINGNIVDIDTIFVKGYDKGAIVKYVNNTVKYIDGLGEDLTNTLQFENGIASIKFNDGICKYIRQDNTEISSSNWVGYSCFKNGFATVKFGNENYGFINEEGKIIGGNYNKILPCSEGLFVTQFQDGRWGFVNTSAEELATGFLAIDSFSENLAAVYNEDGLCGYINHDMEMVAEGFKSVKSFDKGLGFVKFVDGDSGYVDCKGQVVVKQKEEFKPSKTFTTKEECLKAISENYENIVNIPVEKVKEWSLIAADAIREYSRKYFVQNAESKTLKDEISTILTNAKNIYKAKEEAFKVIEEFEKKEQEEVIKKEQEIEWQEQMKKYREEQAKNNQIANERKNKEDIENFIFEDSSLEK